METQIKDLPSAGTPLRTTYIPAQQDSAIDIGQRIQISDLAVNTVLSGQDFANDVKWMTPYAFDKNIGTTGQAGTVRLADDSAINALTADRVITADKNTVFMRKGIAVTGNLSATDLDPTTEGTVSALNIDGSTYGKKGQYQGAFTYDSDSNSEGKNLYFNNARQPTKRTVGVLAYERSDQAGITLLGACYISASGAGVDGVGQVKIEIHTGVNGVNWDTGLTYTIDINLDYFAQV